VDTNDDVNEGESSRMQSVVVGAADPEIVALEAELRRAQLDADVATLDRLIADELLFTGPDGRLGTKAEDLAAHGSGVVRFREHEPEELRVLAVGDTVRVVALGIANPRPSFPPDCDMMNVLTPTTSPRMLTSGPPEFPGLIGASVCT